MERRKWRGVWVAVGLAWVLWSGCSGAECKESCASSEECDDGLVCVTPIGQDKQCLPEACRDCPETCSYNQYEETGECLFVSCPSPR